MYITQWVVFAIWMSVADIITGFVVIVKDMSDDITI